MPSGGPGCDGLKVRIQASEETETEVLIPRPGPTPDKALDSRTVLTATVTRWARPYTKQGDGQAGREGPERVLSCLVNRESREP